MYGSRFRITLMYGFVECINRSLFLLKSLLSVRWFCSDYIDCTEESRRINSVYCVDVFSYIFVEYCV